MRFLRNSKLLWFSIAIAIAVGAVLTIVLFNGHGDSPRLSIVNSYVQLTLRSNREVAGLDYAYFALSNRTAYPIGYIGDQNRQPLSSVIEERFDSRIGRAIRTNHTLPRLLQMRSATLAPYSSVEFMAYYPSSLTGAVLIVNYFPAKTRLARTAENLKLKATGNPAKPTNEFDSIKVKLPLPH